MCITLLQEFLTSLSTFATTKYIFIAICPLKVIKSYLKSHDKRNLTLMAISYERPRGFNLRPDFGLVLVKN